MIAVGGARCILSHILYLSTYARLSSGFSISLCIYVEKKLLLSMIILHVSICRAVFLVRHRSTKPEIAVVSRAA
ncbi:hypothetical protein B0T24DRAFT_164019 [Lasiosphaeria ovina]|uniref:Uncharacterized protein n=1 Tax=Lasiosphaeria ovina TaxID=92902 RepID=A0AAE0NDQ1_9PEZI|nr:hypothetical protein B0T24DRAFT_164019 [Lasiosphaeria ovina]